MDEHHFHWPRGSTWWGHPLPYQARFVNQASGKSEYRIVGEQHWNPDRASRLASWMDHVRDDWRSLLSADRSRLMGLAKRKALGQWVTNRVEQGDRLTVREIMKPKLPASEQSSVDQWVERLDQWRDWVLRKRPSLDRLLLELAQAGVIHAPDADLVPDETHASTRTMDERDAAAEADAEAWLAGGG